MNRSEAKELLPVIQAFAEGKTIQVKGPDNRWYDYDSKDCKLKFDSDLQKYRIKPKYRSFANAEECWQEMLKHKPFGWVKYREASISLITQVSLNCVSIGKNYYFKEAREVFTFADGTPFGIKDE